MYIGTLIAHMFVVRSPGPRVTDSCELPSKGWELNLVPLEKQLSLTTEPSVQTFFFFFVNEGFQHRKNYLRTP